jgi:hypothetical protein
MTETEFQERRKFRRFVIAIPSTYFRFELNQGNDAETQDLSCTGIGFVTDEGLPVNTRLSIWIKPPDNEKQILTQGAVIWSHKIEFKKYRIGITLEDPGIKPLPIILRTIQAKL